MTINAHKPRQLILATALELLRVHGVRLAALYLHDEGITLDVAVDLLAYASDPISHGTHVVKTRGRRN